MSLKGPFTSQRTDRSPSSLGHIGDVWMVLLIFSCFFLYIFSFSMTFFFLCFPLPASLPFILSQVLSPPSFPYLPIQASLYPLILTVSHSSLCFPHSCLLVFSSHCSLFPPISSNLTPIMTQIFLSCRLCQGLWWSVWNPEGPSG